MVLRRRIPRRDTSDQETLIPRTVDGAFTALRETLEHERPEPSALARIANPLRVLCSRAREEGMAPEDLIVRLKEALDVVPGFDGRHAEAPDRNMRSQIVSYTIDMYFSGTGEGRPEH